jgi:glycosyltransferase involved in cell wall biosynthesis
LNRCHVIPHGLEAQALTDLGKPEPEGDYLICAATIAPRKNNLLLAEAARRAQVPIVFLGKPFAESDPYFQKFKQLVDGRLIRYPGWVTEEEKLRLLRGARGFALLSQFESGCISVYEAAAAGLPLFLSKLPWAADVYQHARDKTFVPLRSAEAVAPILRQFYDRSHRQPGQTFPIQSWGEIGRRYVNLYEALLKKL